MARPAASPTSPTPRRCSRRSTATPWPTASSSRAIEELKDDGSTACGCWIYCGVYPEEGRNRAKERNGEPDEARQPQLGLGLAGQPAHDVQPRQRRPRGQALERAQEIRLVGRGAAASGPAWMCPTSSRPSRPSYRPAPDAKGMDAIDGDSPFILKPDGKGWLFAPGGTKDGPLPTHYEPVESPVANALYKQRINPTAQLDVGAAEPDRAPHGPRLSRSWPPPTASPSTI